jgi:hypothetical protein
LLSRILLTYLFIAGLFTSLSAQPESISVSSVSYFDTKFSPVEKIIYYRLGDKTTIPVTISQYGDKSDVVYINVHDSEPTSVQAAKKILEISGGTLIKIENRGQRNIQFRLKNVPYSFDPNRIFDRIGVEQALKKTGRISNAAVDEVEKFGLRILELLPADASCIVALHNNTDGAFSVKTYLPAGERHRDAKAVFANKEQDIDDIALTTDSLLYQKMADGGYNSIWQDNKKAKRDGSLSIYCGQNNLRYINIETQLGRLSQHIEMLEKLVAILKGKEAIDTDAAAVKTEVAEN